MHTKKYGDVNHDLNNVSSSSNGSGSGSGSSSSSSNGSEGDDSLLLANLGLGKNVESVYMKGLKNLGLDAELSGEGVAAVLRDTAAYRVFDGATGTAGGYTYGGGVGGGSAVHRAGGVSLDDFEYYKISPSTSARGASQSPPHKASRGSGSSGTAGGRKYHWQSENFGTSLESLPPQL